MGGIYACRRLKAWVLDESCQKRTAPHPITGLTLTPAKQTIAA